MKTRKISDIVKISTKRVFQILLECLGIRKLSARCLPHLLLLDQKRCCVTTSQQCLDMYQRNPNESLRSYVTVHETWIHRCTPGTKLQSKMCIVPNERAANLRT